MQASKKLKVLHVIPSVGSLRGGPSRAVYNMAYGVEEFGHTVHIATTDDNAVSRLVVPYGQPVVKHNVTTWYFPRQTRFYTVSWPLTRWLAGHIGGYDLVHIHSLFSYASLPAALFAHHYGIPYIVRPLGTLNQWGMANRRRWLKRISFRLIESRILAHAAGIHYTSNQERLEAKALGIDQFAAVIPLGINLSAFAHLPASGTFRHHYPQLVGRTLLLFLSRLDPIKGLELLLPAFAQVRQKQPNIGLILAGRGAPDYEAWLRAQVQELSLEGDLVFTGFLRAEQKLAALADCDLFVLPSYSESFGVAVVEAMAAGLPVVITDRVGIYDAVKQANAGLVVPCNADALAAALLRLANDAELRRQMATNGQHLAHDRFSLPAMTRSLIALYEDVLQRQLRQPTR